MQKKKKKQKKKNSPHKQHECIFNMSVRNFQINCLKLYKELIVITCHPILAIGRNISKIKKATILKEEKYKK